MSIYDHLEFKHFKYIVAIAEEGTFTAAAARLPLAQSACLAGSPTDKEIVSSFGSQSETHNAFIRSDLRAL